MALDDDLLQRYFDGELSPVEERSVRGQVEGDAAAQARLRELAKLSELIPTVASLAVAAAALVVLLVPHETSEKLATVPAPAAVQTVHGSRVENVDFGKSTGTVFEVDNEGVSAAVVWIADDEEESP
jgi:anti-sigma factor RsiW